MSHRYRLPPTVDVQGLTSDQIATLALLGNPDECARRTAVMNFDATPPALVRTIPGIHPQVARRYSCPVVMYRGKPRAIMPNGDIREMV